MLISAMVLAVIGLAALVTAVVTSNELIAWVCIGASALGVILLIADAIRDRKRRRLTALESNAATQSMSAVAGGSVAAAVSARDEAPTEIVEEFDDDAVEVVDYAYDEGSDEDLHEDLDLEDLDFAVSEQVSDVHGGDRTDRDLQTGDLETGHALADEGRDEEIERAAENELDAENELNCENELDEEIDLDEAIEEEDFPDEVVRVEPEFDTYGDDEQEFPEPAEEAALHTVVIYESATTPDTEAAVIYRTDAAYSAGDGILEGLEEGRSP